MARTATPAVRQSWVIFCMRASPLAAGHGYVFKRPPPRRQSLFNRMNTKDDLHSRSRVLV